MECIIFCSHVYPRAPDMHQRRDMNIYIYIYICVCVCHIYIYIYINIYICIIDIYIYICVCVCVYECVYLFVPDALELEYGMSVRVMSELLGMSLVVLASSCCLADLFFPAKCEAAGDSPPVWPDVQPGHVFLCVCLFVCVCVCVFFLGGRDGDRCV